MKVTGKNLQHPASLFQPINLILLQSYFPFLLIYKFISISLPAISDSVPALSDTPDSFPNGSPSDSPCSSGIR